VSGSEADLELRFLRCGCDARYDSVGYAEREFRYFVERLQSKAGDHRQGLRRGGYCMENLLETERDKAVLKRRVSELNTQKTQTGIVTRDVASDAL
jgi:hypothetical protein